MKRRACTAFLADGETRCGRVDTCAHVTVQTAAGQTTVEHWVCRRCRRRMGLPRRDVVLTPNS